jgi:quercetin dioxygenase-like cupin family protein
MNVKKMAIVAAMALGSIALSATVQAQTGTGAKTLAAKEIKWGENPALPKGVKAVILAGDPMQGAYTTRVQLAANAKIMPHSHIVEHHLTVLSGTLLYAEGDKFDAAKLKSYPAGSFIVETAKVPHYSSAKGPVVFQVTVPAKSSFDYVDAKDDPRKK